jgi:zinc protease
MNGAGRLFPGSRSRIRRLRRAGAAILLGSLASRSTEGQASAPPLGPLAYTRFTLPNGLVAILNEDHATPIVSVQVWYHVGSKDDDPARPGIVHVCEHLVSQGSPHLSQPQRDFYRSLGGASTHFAETWEDVTKYYITVPNNELETVLWAESDRMAAPLALADSQRIAAVRRVVEQERRQNVDNVPFGAYHELTRAALFPLGHPYHLAPNAAPSSARVAEVRATCIPYYVPSNAVLAISGDFTTAAARSLIEKYFGGIPSGSPVTRPAPKTEPLAAERRLVLEDARANQPQLHIAWLGASYGSPDRMAALAVASVLSVPRFGRLSKLLVNDRQLASSVAVENHDFERSGVFEIIIVPNPGASMTLIEHLTDSTLASFATTPVTAEELARFNAFNRVDAATSLQLHFARADTLAHDEIFAGDPGSYAKQANVALSLTPADVQAAIRRYITPGRVVMSLVPAGKLDLISKPNLPYTNVTPPNGSASPGVRP